MYDVTTSYVAVDSNKNHIFLKSSKKQMNFFSLRFKISKTVFFKLTIVKVYQKNIAKTPSKNGQKRQIGF